MTLIRLGLLAVACGIALIAIGFFVSLSWVVLMASIAGGFAGFIVGVGIFVLSAWREDD